MIGLKRGEVQLLNHQPSWKKEAHDMIDKIHHVMRDDALDIQHIGSTSIDSIKAKPIIDLVMAVHDFSIVKHKIPALAKLGFQYNPQADLPNAMYFNRKIDNDTVSTHHLHVLKHNSFEWKHHINFRDYLNTHKHVAKAYESLKIKLLKAYPKDRVMYTELKAPFIKQVIRKAQVHGFLNTIIEIQIDRPIGTTHPKHPEIIYPINYGYIDQEMAPDGEYLDVYLLGVDKPVTSFVGKIIGIVHRENDVEDKLVMAPIDKNYTKDVIQSMIHFQEQFYISTIETMDEPYKRGKIND